VWSICARIELEVFLDKDHLGKGNAYEQLTVGSLGTTVYIAFLNEKYVEKVGEAMVERDQKVDCY